MQVVEHFLPEMKDQWENYTKRHDEEMVSLEEKELPQTGSGAAIIRHNKSKRIAHAIAYDKGMVFDLGRRGKISINDYMNWMAVNNYSVDYVFRIHAGMNLQINLDELNNQTDRTEKES
jgi:hypothetical protein